MLIDRQQKSFKNARSVIFPFCCMVFTLLLSLKLNAAETSQVKRSNVVIIDADDLGWRGLSSYGSELYETPNIDRLATEGIKFTNAYATGAVCSPTRASLLTGKTPARLHFTHIVQAKGRWPGNSPLIEPDWTPFLPLEEVTIAEALKPNRYVNAHIGKWHIGGGYGEGQEDAPEANPLKQGFDLNIAGSVSGQPPDYYFPYKRHYPNKSRAFQLRNMPPGKEGDYLTDVLTDQALAFLDRQSAQKGPFFLHMSFFTPHTSMGDRLQAKPETIKKYKEKLKCLPDSAQKNPVYAAMIEHMDDAVGRIVGKLKKLGIEKNTVVLFISDNGGYGRKTSDLPLRGAKASCYEGGIRVPTIVYWPGIIEGGKVCDVPITTADIFPTVSEIAGATPKTNGEIDGRSIMPLLTGQGEWKDRPVFWHFPHYSQSVGPYSIVRQGDYKLIEFLEDGKLELYDLKNDLSEKHNLATAKPEKVEELRTVLNKWRKNVDAQLPRKK